MKKYIVSAYSHQRAMYIAKDLGIGPNDFIYVPSEDGQQFRQSLQGMRIEHESQLIGYFSRYEREYLSTYSQPVTFSFSKALELIKQGKKVKRQHWGGYWFMPRSVALLDGPIENEAAQNFNPMIVACLKDNGGYAPASPYQDDLLAEDWSEVI